MNHFVTKFAIKAAGLILRASYANYKEHKLINNSYNNKTQEYNDVSSHEYNYNTHRHMSLFDHIAKGIMFSVSKLVIITFVGLFYAIYMYTLAFIFYDFNSARLMSIDKTIYVYFAGHIASSLFCIVSCIIKQKSVYNEYSVENGLIVSTFFGVAYYYITSHPTII